MVAAKAQQPKTEDEAQTQPLTGRETADMDALLARIEAFLSSPPPSIRLTEEARVALAAPLDPKYLKTRKGQGGKLFTYCDLDYLERRAGEVDPDWGVHFDATTPNVLTCTVTILSISRSATAGYFLPQKYEVSRWNPDTRKSESAIKDMNPEEAHTRVTRAQAAAERRAFAMFGLGAELWASQESEHSEGGEESPKASTPVRAGNSNSGGGEFRAPSEARVNLLVDLGVPAGVAKLINSWSTGKDSKGQPISDVSKTITALFEARGRDKGPVSQRVWERIVNENAPYALSSAGNTNDDDYEDDDF